MALGRKAVRGTFWSMVQKVGTQGFAFLVFLVLSRLLDSEAFGLLAIATVFTAFVITLADAGFSSAIVQFTTLDREDLDTAFWTAMIAGVGLTGIVVIGADFIADLFGEPALGPIIRWLSLGFILTSLSSVQQASLQRNLAYRELALRYLISTILGGVAGIVAAFLGFGVWSLVVQNTVTGFTGVLVLWRVYPWRPRFHFSPPHFKRLFHFGNNIVINNILNFLNARMDEFLIGLFLGATVLGYYTIGYGLLRVMIDVLVALNYSVAFSTFSRLQENPALMRQAFYKVTQLTSLITFPAFTALSMLAPEVVPLLFGEQWRPSIPIAQILGPIGALYSLSYFNSTVLLGAGKPAWRVRILLVSMVANLIGFAIALPWGIEAVATAKVIVTYIWFPLSLYTVHLVLDLDFKQYFQRLLPQLLGSFVLIITVMAIRYFVGDLVADWVRLMIMILAGGAVYSLTTYLTAPTLYQQLFDLVQSALPQGLRMRLDRYRNQTQ